jgi:hypothetical protein
VARASTTSDVFNAIADGHLLYLIAGLNQPTTGLMISALVSYLPAPT